MSKDTVCHLLPFLAAETKLRKSVLVFQKPVVLQQGAKV